MIAKTFDKNTSINFIYRGRLIIASGSNRRKQFCRPVPSHSAKSTLVLDCKDSIILSVDKISFRFFYSPLITTIKKEQHKKSIVLCFVHSYRMILRVQFFIGRWRHVFGIFCNSFRLNFSLPDSNNKGSRFWVICATSCDMPWVAAPAIFLNLPLYH